MSGVGLGSIRCTAVVVAGKVAKMKVAYHDQSNAVGHMMPAAAAWIFLDRVSACLGGVRRWRKTHRERILFFFSPFSSFGLCWCEGHLGEREMNKYI